MSSTGGSRIGLLGALPLAVLLLSGCPAGFADAIVDLQLDLGSCAIDQVKVTLTAADGRSDDVTYRVDEISDGHLGARLPAELATLGALEVEVEARAGGVTVGTVSGNVTAVPGETELLRLPAFDCGADGGPDAGDGPDAADGPDLIDAPIDVPVDGDVGAPDLPDAGPDLDVNLPDLPPPDLPAVCQSTGTTCQTESETLVICQAGSAPTSQSCPLGCAASGTDCVALVPSNNLDQDFAGTYDLQVEAGADVDIDTENLLITCNPVSPCGVVSGSLSPRVVVQGGGNPGIAVFRFRSISIPDNVRVRVKGTRALALVASGDIVIAGSMDLRPPGIRIKGGGIERGGINAQGPGALATNATQGTCGPSMFGGGSGGGGFAAAGRPGGSSRSASTTIAGGPGGPVLTTPNPALVPLRGGAAGAGSACQDSGEGGGGGALQLVSGTEIRFESTARINAGGGGGNGLLTAGGGAGGGLLLEAPRVTLPAGAVLAANGGGGGGADGTDGAGQPGQPSRTPALGGETVSPNGRGGLGGARDGAATAGANASSTAPSAQGGSGGGGVGVIRVNSRNGNQAVLSGTISPAATEAPVTTR